jgi:predicted N-acyltransferase
VAGALNFIGRDTLYGRYWGCIEDHPCLHFELCYYQAIDFAIAQGWAGSRRARRASTSWRAAICR